MREFNEIRVHWRFFVYVALGGAAVWVLRSTLVLTLYGVGLALLVGWHWEYGQRVTRGDRR